MAKQWRRIAAVVIAACFGLACGVTMWRARFAAPKHYVALDKRAPFLKVHTRDGGVYVLKRWSASKSPSGKTIRGEGLRYNAERKLLGKGKYTVSFTRVVLLETNQPQTAQLRNELGALVTIGIISVTYTAIAVYCTLNPKACFGSCPTFYAHDGRRMALQAEGFSDSVAAPLEATDVDALSTAKPVGRRFSLLMTNEALETHVVRGVRLLAVRKPAGTQRVFRADNRYFPATAVHPPRSCRSGYGGDCLAAVRHFDKREYTSPADPHDLAKRETVELRFAPIEGRVGLVVGARNSLMNTFLFYQALAYMGSLAGEWMIKLQHGDPAMLAGVRRMGRLLGGIDVSVWDGRKWRQLRGRYNETGPIAREVQLVLLPRKRPPGDVRLRLQMTRGYWKIDQLALARLAPAVKPVALAVRRVLRAGKAAPSALALLRDPRRHLVTHPRDAYSLEFQLPPDPGAHELFVEATGYYVEWIRQRWLAEEDQDKVLEMFLQPRRALRRLAPAYKRREKKMEQIFWQSRLDPWRRKR